MRTFFTSESVTEGHPDKVCDLISDSILDAIIEKDPSARVACETLVTTGLVMISGEITTNSYVDVQKIVRTTVEGIGYTRAKYGFDAETCSVLVSLEEQSPDIAMGVDKSLENKLNQKKDEELGAGDQGIMFGFACDETPEFMPLPISLAHKLAKRLSEVRKKKIIKGLRPDGKTQVTVEYEDSKPKRVEAIVVSTQHREDKSQSELRDEIIEHVIKNVVDNSMIDENTKIYINPTGAFVLGGPKADTGLTGRKIIVDTYGGYARHGGGAFSGKDPTKVDRSASYAARYIAKNIVAAGLASKCEIELCYAIGKAEPLAIYCDTYGTGKLEEDKIIEIIKKHFPLTPLRIIEELNLRRPIYAKTSNYGHFGKEGEEFTWEKLDKVEILKEYL